MTKNILFCLCLISISLVSILLIWPDDKVHIVFCNVGQGDAILVQNKFSQVLIDAGPNEEVISCLDRHLPFWDRTLDLVVATHMDSDHIGGMPVVLKKYFIHQLLVSSLSGESDAILEFKKALLEEKKFGINMYLLGFAIDYHLEEKIKAKFFVPGRDEAEQIFNLTLITETMLSDSINRKEIEKDDKNNLSIATFFNIDGISILLMGDLPAEIELAAVDKAMIRKTNILKASHHGAKTSTSMELLTKIRPETVVISVGENNQYSHPSIEVMKNLEELGINVFRTDTHGDVKIIINGDSYLIN